MATEIIKELKVNKELLQLIKETAEGMKVIGFNDDKFTIHYRGKDGMAILKIV
ncbi:hypothetical protein QUF88_15845 [Bacillus sp. DX1.1]|uniref:hypothetical protein n=1 Tax=unclassified Bacillus (in: firmicutes) TaxID=185979 RepID=UPI00256FEBA3|nr:MULTISPECIES: hypothetical protein [unclassified Bacillus (in: firmicutes)]MDM5155225.1 hypothetical protein [Bacillus sp. DX1.1]WJE79544.1 hypothetical protein QRE67_13340 [Bacillus sp. DX3.1]